jgi:hypothetical protein
MGKREVKELPLNGRSYDQLLTLNPGIVNYISQRAGGIGTSNSVVGNMFSASGRRPQENLFGRVVASVCGLDDMVNFAEGGYIESHERHKLRATPR